MSKTKKVESEKLPTNGSKAWASYSEIEKENYRENTTILCAMRDNLRRPLVEFDDVTYFNAYEENRKADLAYNQPIDETIDFKVTTGLTREKDTTLLSTITNMNFQPSITAFDKEQTLINGLGEEAEDLVKKSRELEAYDEKRVSMYRELIAQGTVFVEEVYVEKAILKGFDNGWLPTMPVEAYISDVMPIYDIEGKCETKLHLGKYVMFSSMNEEELQNNSVVATYEEVDRSVAQSIYGNWARWNLVPSDVNNQVNPFTEGTETNKVGSDYSWNTYKVNKGKVGITKVMKRYENKFQIFLNGVMMLPCDFPLTKVSPSGLYPIAKGVNERIPNFAYGKGIPSKTKVDQKLYDTLLRAMVGKAWQSYRPTLGNRSGNVLSRDILTSGNIVHGINQNEIFPILPAQLLTLTAGDTTMFQMVKEMINDKTVSDSYGAQTQQDNTTATQIVNEQKQTLLKLSSTIDGVRSLEKRLIMLRVYNIIANWTRSQDTPLEEETMEIVNGIETITGKKIDPVKVDKKYKKYTMNKSFSDGKKGIKTTQFIGNDTKLISPREQIDMEENLTEQYGKPTRISYINADWLKNLSVIWNIDTIVQSDTDDHMNLLVYMDNLTRVAQLFGVQVFKQDYVLQRVSEKMSEDFDKMFNVQDMMAYMEQIKAQILGGNQQAGQSQAQPALPSPMATQIKNPVQQQANSMSPTPLSVAKVQA